MQNERKLDLGEEEREDSAYASSKFLCGLMRLNWK
ncbi:hypothetical protein Tco_1574406, partial [Tanacetum coccineum]